MTTKTKLDKLLTSLHACQEARDWVKKEGHKTLAAAWAACPRGDWMLWLAGGLSGGKESVKRKKLVRAACECARLVLPIYERRCPGDGRVRACIETAEAWSNGTATLEQVRAAIRDADTAADAANAADAAYAADAAAYAVYAVDGAAVYAAIYACRTVRAAADAAAYYLQYQNSRAAFDVARVKTLAQCADIMRRRYPLPPKP